MTPKAICQCDPEGNLRQLSAALDLITNIPIKSAISRTKRMKLCCLLCCVLFLGNACTTHVSQKEPSKSSALREINASEAVTQQLIDNWRERWTKERTSLIVGTDIGFLSGTKQDSNRTAQSIHLAEAGLLSARILRQITDVHILSNNATATLFTDSAVPPYGLVTGTSESVSLRPNRQGVWQVDDVRTITIRHYSITGDSNMLNPLFSPLPK